MSKKVLGRVAAAILTTGLATTGIVVGSSGPADAAYTAHHRHPKPPVITPIDDGGIGTDGGVVTNKFDTGWG